MLAYHPITGCLHLALNYERCNEAITFNSYHIITLLNPKLCCPRFTVSLELATDICRQIATRNFNVT